MIKVKTFIYHSRDELLSNTYIAYDESFACLIIDPSNGNDVIDFINKNNLKPLAILLSHGHYDHFIGVNKIKSVFDIPIYIHEDDVQLLTDPYKNCSLLMGRGSVINHKVNPIKDYDLIQGLEEDLLVLSTPYHSEGSCCFYFIKNKILFTGDSLFKDGFGRDDLPTGNPYKRRSSLKKIFSIKDDVIIYPGHGEITTLKKEVVKYSF